MNEGQSAALKSYEYKRKRDISLESEAKCGRLLWNNIAYLAVSDPYVFTKFAHLFRQSDDLFRDFSPRKRELYAKISTDQFGQPFIWFTEGMFLWCLACKLTYGITRFITCRSKTRTT